MHGQTEVPDKAIFLNGMFEDTLLEIEAMQNKDPQQHGYLQPYDGVPIILLERATPTGEHPITLYISLTNSLDKVSYTAKAVGWKDKRKLTAIERAAFTHDLNTYQPSEKDGIYLQANGRDCVNLIIVSAVKRLDKQLMVSEFKKTRDYTPLRARQTPGKWAYVFELPVSK